jgi:hypothetical protein
MPILRILALKVQAIKEGELEELEVQGVEDEEDKMIINVYFASSSS